MKKRTKALLRRILPPWITAAKRDCGGINKHPELFGANLAQKELSNEAYVRMVNSLIFPNGVRKSTGIRRNAPLLATLLDSGQLGWDKPSIRVLDMGASIGMDATGNLEEIQKHIQVESYTLADLFTALLYDPERKLIFDQDGKVIQVMLDQSFASLYFEFKYRIEPLYHIANLIRTYLLRRKFKKIIPDPETTLEIPLVFPPVKEQPAFRVQRADVFKTIPGTYDLILCFNLLQPRYFTKEQIETGNDNLTEALNPGGFLVTGVTDTYQVVQKPLIHQSSAAQ